MIHRCIECGNTVDSHDIEQFKKCQLQNNTGVSGK